MVCFAVERSALTLASSVRASIKAGNTADQAAAEYKVNPRFKGYVASLNPAFGGALANMKIAYQELGAK